MPRDKLIALLKAYRPDSAEQRERRAEFISFINREADCLERSLEAGHITASAFVLSPDLKSAMLLHHRKLNKWLQPGGHADGCPDLEQVARREAEQECGLRELTALSKGIFDLDIHPIPSSGAVAEHLHYDARFLLQAESWECRRNEESFEIAWIGLHELERYTCERSVLRMAEKFEKAAAQGALTPRPRAARSCRAASTSA